MMYSNLDRKSVEAYLTVVLNAIHSARIRNVTSLRCFPELYRMFGESLYLWMRFVALKQSGCSNIISSFNSSNDDLSGIWFVRLLNTDRRRSKKNDDIHPVMDGILTLLHKDGTHNTIIYMMSSGVNICRDFARRAGKIIDNPGFVSTDEMRPDPVPSADEDDNGNCETNCFDAPDASILHNESMSAVFGCFDKEFLKDITLLATSLGMPHKEVQAEFCANRIVLTEKVIGMVNEMLHGNYNDAFTPLLEAARSYVMPKEFCESPDAMLRYMYRATSKAARAKMAARIRAAIAS